MGQGNIVKARREMRKVMGPAATDLAITNQIRIRHISAIIHRGFFGRLKWLLFGK